MKCLFDNNLSIKLAKTLNFLEGEDGVHVVHLREKFLANTPDIEWITELGKEGGWFIITEDRQIRNKPHEKIAWQESNLPVVFLNRGWASLNFWDIAWKIIKCWPEVKKCVSYNINAKTFELPVKGKIKVLD